MASTSNSFNGCIICDLTSQTPSYPALRKLCHCNNLTLNPISTRVFQYVLCVALCQPSAPVNNLRITYEVKPDGQTKSKKQKSNNQKILNHVTEMNTCLCVRYNTRSALYVEASEPQLCLALGSVKNIRI